MIAEVTRGRIAEWNPGAEITLLDEMERSPLT